MRAKPAILRPVQVGRLLGLGRSRVYSLVRQGVLPSVRIAGAIWIPRLALEEWLREQSRRALAVTRTTESGDGSR